MTRPKSIEDVQQYWDKRPCNIQHSNAEVGSRQYFDEVDKRRYFVEPHIINFANFESWSNKRVLEIGCGIGTDMIRFVRAGAVYVGTDISGKSLDIARKRLDVYGLSAHLVQSDCEDLQLPKVSNGRSSHFDLIYSFGVLHHTPDISKALRSIRELASDKTEFRFMVYAKRSWKAAMIEAGLDQPEAQAGCPIANLYYVEEIEELLARNGWRSLKITQDHIFQWKIPQYLKHQYEREPYFLAMPQSVISACSTGLGWHLLVRAKIAI
jgi:SAM-dependent methyltransferase